MQEPRTCVIVSETAARAAPLRRGLTSLGYQVARLAADEALAARPRLWVVDLDDTARAVELAAAALQQAHALVLLVGAPPAARLAALPAGRYALVPRPPRRAVVAAMLELLEAQEAARDARTSLSASLRDRTFVMQRAHAVTATGAWCMDLRSDTITWTEEMYALHGVDPGTFVPTPENTMALVAERSDDLMLAWARAISSRDLGQAFVYKIRRQSDGAVRALQARGQVSVDGDGVPHFVIGITQDVTDQRIAGELEESRERFRTLYEHASEGIFRLHPDGTIAEANAAFATLLGWPNLDVLLGRPLAQLFVEPGECARMLAGDHRLRREARWRRADGSQAVVEIAGRLLRSAGQSYFQGVVRDLTADRARAERERILVAHKEQLELVIEGTRLGFWDWSPVEDRYRCNHRLAEMFGYTLDEWPPGGSWIDTIHPGDRASYIEAVNRHLSGERSFHEHTHRVRHKDGRWLHVLDRGRVFARDAEGHPIRVCGTYTDITAEKTAERLAIEASDAKTHFLANMSHELRTPLNAVLGLSEALLEHTFGAITEPQTRSLQTIHDSGRHLLALINDVLDLSRIEAGQLAIAPRRTAVRGLLDEAVALVQPLASARGQTLLLDVAPGLPAVDVDHRRIVQVLINLLGNAIKFSPRQTPISVRARSEGTDVLVEVRDAGPGIARDDLARVFEPFVTLDHPLSKDGSGAGLGLALVKRLTELQRGSVRVESEVGRGTTFTLRFPAVAERIGAEQPPPERPAPTRPRRPARPRVLLAEDNEANILATRGYLESLGYQVELARDGAAAVSAAVRADISLVLMDIQLPVLDGLEAIRRIRATPAGAGKPIIALTAYAMPGDAERCLAAGATVYMSKPVGLRHLAETMAEHLPVASP